MNQFIIQGGAALSGDLPVNGAKNHALKLIPACLLSSGTSTLHRVPLVEDVLRLLEIVEAIGGTVKRAGQTVHITSPEKCSGELPADLVPQLRASLVLLGPLLTRFGRVVLPPPGGDKIGQRPMNLFIDAFTQLGAQVDETAAHTEFRAPDGLHGAVITFPMITVTGTETVMLAATRASGTTVIQNAACEPEVLALAEQLNNMGAQISGAGTHTITIQGVANLHPAEHVVMPDRIEAGSFIMLAAATNSPLRITDCNPAHLQVPLRLLSRMGVQLTVDDSSVRVTPTEQPLQPLDIVTHEYPGFSTDLQPAMTMLLTQAHGTSTVRETIFEGRLFFIDRLKQLGADVELIDQYRARITGPAQFQGHRILSPDIRAGLAMIIAGLLANGTTTIENIYQIDRGYERIEERLQAIGASITRQPLA